MAVTPRQRPWSRSSEVPAETTGGAPYDATGAVALQCSRCQQCGTRSFPPSEHCPRCGADSQAVEALPRTGRLWTWTSQSVRPKSPPYAGAEAAEDFVPFLVGYVQFHDLCVEGRLVDCGPAPVIGAPMEAVERTVAHGADGDPVTTYVFRPVDQES